MKKNVCVSYRFICCVNIRGFFNEINDEIIFSNMWTITISFRRDNYIGIIDSSIDMFKFSDIMRTR
jgi:hypothetical protein